MSFSQRSAGEPVPFRVRRRPSRFGRLLALCLALFSAGCAPTQAWTAGQARV